MLGNTLADNLIVLLAFDDNHSILIKNSVPINLWPVLHRVVASRCYEFIDQYKVPPKDHLPDLVEDKLIKGDSESDLYYTLLSNIKQASLNGINNEYAIKRLDIFVRRQSYRSVSVEITRALQLDTEESLDRVDQLFAQAKKSQLVLFDPGTKLNDKSKALRFLEQTEGSFPTGIPELDKRGFGPTRKELWMAIGDAKSGKSMLLIHLGKMAIRSRLKVCHVTLEMSETKVAQRYFQTIFDISKRYEEADISKLKKDDKGLIETYLLQKRLPTASLQDQNIKARLEYLIDKWGLRQLDNLYIKQFPTGTLTISELNAYLDNLESSHRFQPDMIIVDYPELMKLDPNNFRLGIDKIYKDLRGIAVDRNVAMVVVSQSNRTAANKKIVNSSHIAESYSKVQHCDIALTINATKQEKQYGLARLIVTNARNDEGNLALVISQNYRTSTFVVDAAIQSTNYWSLFPDEDEANE